MDLDIEHLDDATAIRVLQTLARARPRADVPDPDELRHALPTPAGAGVDCDVRDADLARATLAWLAQDPEQRPVIESIASAPAPAHRAFDPGLGALFCVLLLLKTRAVIERDKDGRWRFKVELVELKQGPLSAVLDLVAKLAKRG